MTSTNNRCDVFESMELAQTPPLRRPCLDHEQITDRRSHLSSTDPNHLDRYGEVIVLQSIDEAMGQLWELSYVKIYMPNGYKRSKLINYTN
jgi:hypothetical protein